MFSQEPSSFSHRRWVLLTGSAWLGTGCGWEKEPAQA